MDSGESLKWRLRTPLDPDVDAVEFALGCDAVAMLYGPHPFDFSKTLLANGDLRLVLSPDGHGDAEEGIATTHVLGNLESEVDVPAGAHDHDSSAASQKVTKAVLALGRALFSDVARRVDVVTRKSVTSGELMEPDHEARMEIGCPSCLSAIASSVYYVRRNSVIRCPGCGMSVALGTRTVQDAAEAAEEAWLAERR